MSGPVSVFWAVQAAVGLVVHLVVAEESVVCDHRVPVRAVAVTSWKRVSGLIAWACVSSAFAHTSFQVWFLVGTALIGPLAGGGLCLSKIGPFTVIWAVQAAVDLVIHLVVAEESVVCDHLVSERTVAVT